MKNQSGKKYINLVAGLLFLASVLTSNLRLPFGLQGEYNPIAALALSLFCFFFDDNRRHRKAVIASWIVVPITATIVFHLFMEGVDWSSVMKLLVGPIFLISGSSVLRFVPFKSYLVVLYLFLLYLVVGLVDSGFAVKIALMFNDRGSLYYQGWNSFFSSEPSYAAISVAMVGCLSLMKVGSKIRIEHLVIVISILLSTACLTGYLFAILFLAHLLIINNKLFAFRISILAITFESVIASDWVSSFTVNNRVETIFTAIEVSLSGRAFESFILLEPSSGWRIMTNLVGLFSLPHFPIGTGSTKIQDLVLQVFSIEYQNIWSQLLRVIEVGEVFFPQTVLANYFVFGGWPMGIGLLSVIFFTLYQFWLIGKINFRVNAVALSFMLSGIFWQSALTSPGWWWLCGIFAVGADVASRKANLPNRDGGVALC